MTDTLTPVGPERTGKVSIITQGCQPDFGYILEEGGMRQFAFSDNFNDRAVWDQLVGDTTIGPNGVTTPGVGTRVYFFDNGHNCALKVRLAPTTP